MFQKCSESVKKVVGRRLQSIFSQNLGFQRAFSQSYRKPTIGFRYSSRLATLAGGAAVGVAGLTFYNSHYNSLLLDVKTSLFNLQSVVVDPSISPFPTELDSPSNAQVKFSLMGYGTRKVTFLKFKVYGLGVYIANDDVSKVPLVLDSKYLSSVFVDGIDSTKSHQENLQTALKNPKISEILINNLLDSNVRFIIRIVPLRDTDFNHLRDGFVKSCVRNQLVKSQFPDQLDKGLAELRDIFKKYRSKCPKDHVLMVETDSLGRTSFFYENYGKHPEKQNLQEKILLGTIGEPVISKALLLNYFAGSNPISDEARQKCTEEFVRMC